MVIWLDSNSSAELSINVLHSLIVLLWLFSNFMTFYSLINIYYLAFDIWEINQFMNIKHRAPIVAKCDRKRILSSWAPLCGNVAPKEFQVEFSKVRYLTPQQFVEKLSKELQVRGVVAGTFFLFGLADLSRVKVN